MEKRDLEGIINGLNEIQPLSHRVEHVSLLADELSIFFEARKMLRLLATRQGEEKLKLLEKVQNQQKSVLEEMLTTATHTASSVEIIELADTEDLRRALERAESLLMKEFEVFKKADLLLKRLEFMWLCQH